MSRLDELKSKMNQTNNTSMRDNTSTRLEQLKKQIGSTTQPLPATVPYSNNGKFNPFALTQGVQNIAQTAREEEKARKINEITGRQPTAFVPRKLNVSELETAEQDFKENQRKQELVKDFLPQAGRNLSASVASGLANVHDATNAIINKFTSQNKLFTAATQDLLDPSKNRYSEALKTVQQDEKADRERMQWARDYNKYIQEGNQNYDGLAKGTLNAINVAGNMLASSPAGTPGLFLNSMGGAYNQALDEGATEQEAYKYGLASGALETAVETLSGGAAQKLTNVPAIAKISKLTDKIDNKLLRFGANVVGDVAGEGTEEMITALADPYIQKITYNPDAGFQSVSEALSSMGNAFKESVLPTLLMGGTSSTINGVNSLLNRQISAINSSNLSQNEKRTLINQVKTEAQQIIQNVEKNVTPQSPQTEQTQPTNEVIPQEVQNRNTANMVQNNANAQKPKALPEYSGQIGQNLIDGEAFRKQVNEVNIRHKSPTYIKNDLAEKAANNKVMKVTDVSGNQQFTNSTNIKSDIQNYMNTIPDVIIKENEKKLKNTASGKKEIANKAINKDKKQAIPKIQETVENSTYMNSAEDAKNRPGVSFDYYASPVKTDNGLKIANISDRIVPGTGDTLYSYEIKNRVMSPMTRLEQNGSNTKITHDKTLINNIIQPTEDSVNLPTAEKLNQPSQEMIEAAQALTLEEPQRMNLKKPKLEEIAELTAENAQLPKGSYKQNADKMTAYRRKFWDNVESSKIIGQNIKDKVNMTNYERKTNDDTLNKMKERLDTDPVRLTQEWWAKDIKKATDQDIALGAILLERYQQEGRFDEAVDVVQKLADIGTEAGRTVQMFSIFQRLTPEGMQLYQQRKLNSAFEEMTKKQTGKWVEQNKDKFQLTKDDELFITAKVQEAQNAPTERAKQIALAEIESRINDKLPPEAGQSIKAFRRMAMLFNPKTQVRNVVGNTTVMPLNYVTDLVSTAIDKAIARKTGVRTTALPDLKTIKQGFKKGWNETWDDYKRGIRTTPTGTKYEIQNNAKSFNEETNSTIRNAINRKLNNMDRLLSAVMEAGDRPFYEAAYQNALKGQMKVNGVVEATQDMIDIASNVALSQTWQDNNNYTRFVLGVRNAFNIANINGFGLGDLIIPFAKTPANLTKAMVEYSPAGVIPAIINYTDMQRAISRGEMTPMQQKKFVTSVGKAVAGTVLYVIVNGLVKGGKITGSSDEDKDVANFEKNVLGIQPYSIRIGDKTYTYNWAQPLAAPLAIMSDTYKMSAEGAKWNEILLNAFKVGGDQLVANSFLQGIQDLFSSQYGDEGFGAKFIDALADLPAQFTPTLFGQIATQFDSTKRQTYENGDTVGTMINEVKNKIPGVKNTLAPQVNTFGEEIQNYGGANNPFNVFLNPGNISSANATETQKELYKLYQDTKDKTIFPMQAPYSISGGGEKVKLSSHDRADYQKTSGKYVTENLQVLFDSEYYKTLDNDKKAEVVNAIVSDANTLAKGEYLETKASKDLKEKLGKLGDIPYVEYYNAWSATRGIEPDKNWKGESISGSKKKKQIQAINNATSKNLTNKQREMLYEILNVSGY